MKLLKNLITKVLKPDKKYIILFFILLTTAFLRFYQLGNIPSGMHEDEVAYGYNAYSISLTGKDEHGISLPLMLKSFGEYKPGLYAYLTIPVINLLDLTPFSVRFISALFGTISIFILFFVVFELSKDKKISLISSILLGISPWHISLSRTVSEVVVSMFFILLMQLGISKLNQKYSLKWVLVIFVSAVLAINSYTASLIFVPLILGINLLFTFVKKKLYISKSVLLMFLIILCFSVFYSSITSLNRFNQINVFTHPETKLVLEEQIREDKGNVLVTRIFHNKIINYSRKFIENYSEYFTADFLFINGGNPIRQHIPSSGLFYFWQLPFLIIGIYFIFKERNRFGLFLLTWWLTMLIPAALTFDEIPNVYRSLIVIFPMIVIIAVGIYKMFVFLMSKKSILKIFVIFLALVFLWELGYYSHQYLIHQERHQPWHRGYAFKELVQQLIIDYDKYDKIILTKGNGNPYIYVLYYMKYNPTKYHGLIKLEGNNGFDKFIFTTDDCPLSAGANGMGDFTGEERVLYVNRGDCKDPIKNISLKKTVYWQDQNPAFKLIEYIPSSSDKLK